MIFVCKLAVVFEMCKFLELFLVQSLCDLAVLQNEQNLYNLAHFALSISHFPT